MSIHHKYHQNSPSTKIPDQYHALRGHIRMPRMLPRMLSRIPRSEYSAANAILKINFAV